METYHMQQQQMQPPASGVGKVHAAAKAGGCLARKQLHTGGPRGPGEELERYLFIV